MKVRRLFFGMFGLMLLALAGILFIPRSYDVPVFIEREGTQYWNLSTGSIIGYTQIASKSIVPKTPILYLHGGPGGRISDAVIEALAPLSELGHSLYFYDQVGSGHSNRLQSIGDYSVERHTQDLAEIIDKIGAKKVILIGHSWGTMLAAHYVQQHPNKVERMILEGPGPILPINKSLVHIIPPDSLGLVNPEFTNEEGNRKAYHPRARFILKWANRFHSKWASDQEVDAFFTYLNGELNKSTSCKSSEAAAYAGGSGYYAHIMTVQSFNEVEEGREVLSKSSLPVLVLRGQCDNQKWGFTQEYIHQFPHSQLRIIENAGHDLIAGNREQYIQWMEDFLREAQDSASLSN